MLKIPALLVPFVAAALLAVGSGNAAAELIPMDLSAPGDGLLTRDTVSGLEWLDLPATRTQDSSYYTYDEITAGAGGWRDLGFRHATQAEVAAMLGEFGFPADALFPTGVGYAQGPHLFQIAQEFMKVFGCAEACGTTEERAYGYIASAVPSGGFRPSVQVGIWVQDNPHFPESHRFDGLVDFTARYDLPGAHFLVRTVPEPRVAAMLWIGGFGVFAAGRLRERSVGSSA